MKLRGKLGGYAEPSAINYGESSGIMPSVLHLREEPKDPAEHSASSLVIAVISTGDFLEQLLPPKPGTSSLPAGSPVFWAANEDIIRVPPASHESEREVS